MPLCTSAIAHAFYCTLMFDQAGATPALHNVRVTLTVLLDVEHVVCTLVACSAWREPPPSESSL